MLSSPNLTVEEHADTTAPVISDVILNLDLGRLSILFSETIDVSPGYRVNVSDLALFDDASGESLILFYLAKSRLSTVVDASRLNITSRPVRKSRCRRQFIISRWKSFEAAGQCCCA